MLVVFRVQGAHSRAKPAARSRIVKERTNAKRISLMSLPCPSWVSGIPKRGGLLGILEKSGKKRSTIAMSATNPAQTFQVPKHTRHMRVQTDHYLPSISINFALSGEMILTRQARTCGAT
jgi:hypothetical protein